MMRFAMPFALAAVAIASPVRAQTELQEGFAGALRGCEQWILNPASWASGVAPFVSAVGLGDRMALVERVGEEALPPARLRVANHYWRINSTRGAGFILVVSDQLPMCHITGGGDVDMQPVVASVLAGNAFARAWELVKQGEAGDMASSVFRSREDLALSIVISHAKAPGGRTDRVQVLATAEYDIVRK